MVSKTRKSWEKFKQDVEGWTTSGVEQESWGKRSANRVDNLKLSWKRYRVTPENTSSKENENDEIKGYSSSDDDNDICDNKNKNNSSKLSVSSSSIPYLLKNVGNARQPVDVIKKCNIFTRQFDNSFTPVRTQLEDSQNHSCCSVDESDEEITWSDSDPNEVNLIGSREFTPERNPVTSAIPVSSQQYNTVAQDATCSIIESDIDDFDSDPGEQDVKNNVVTIYEEPSPSISSNTPIPTPTSPKHEKTRKFPPIDSAKKKKQKYLRTGLAEKLHRLLLREQSERSFWLHKIRQSTDSDAPRNVSSNRAEKTVTLKVLSRHLDHSVYVIRCDVIHHDVICERELSGQVIVLLGRESWKHLGCRFTPPYLRLYPPWKVFDLPDCSTPVLLCITHCEVLNDINNITFVKSNITTKPHNFATEHLDQTPTDQKLVPHSPFQTSKTVDDETEKPIQVHNVRMSCGIRDALGYQGSCVMDKVNFVARVQRVYWRPIKMRQIHPLSTSHSTCSSLTLSIGNLLKSSRCSNMLSLCLLVQDSSGVFSEIVLPNDILLNKREWQNTLKSIKGQVISFHSLLLNEHRKQKRRPDLFGMIDLLRTFPETAGHKALEEGRKQNICFTFFMDETSNLSSSSHEEVAFSYCSPRLLSPEDFEANCPVLGYGRVDFYGKLLYIIYENDEKVYNKRGHAQLFISPITQSTDHSWEIVNQVIVVSYRERRGPGWHGPSLSVGQLLFIEDAIPDKDFSNSFTTDYFSSIKIVTSQSTLTENQSEDINDFWRAIMNTRVADEQYDVCKNLPEIVLPTLNAKCEQNALVNFEGVIVGVDQANAYCWFTCNECQSDDISEIPDDSLYICNNCGSDISSLVTNTHLEVYLKSKTTPAIIVKAKLLQSTISNLLPVSDTTSDELAQGYDVQCVLKKHIGPSSWHVVEKNSGKDGGRKITFKLDEIDIKSHT